MSGLMLVTGGSRGIGAATAKLAAQRGYSLCINYSRDATAAETLVSEIAGLGGQAFTVQADIAREEQVDALFECLDREAQPLTALVNNAGIAGPVSRLDQVSGELMRRVVDTNVLGSLYCARAAIQRMAKRHGGRGGGIVNLSSGAASIGSPNEYVWYAASKGAVDSLTLGLAKEVAADGIRVNAVAPGFVKTEIHADSNMPDRLETDAPKVPIGRAAEPEEIAEAILWLLSDAASYTTGTILRVAGGR